MSDIYIASIILGIGLVAAIAYTALVHYQMHKKLNTTHVNELLQNNAAEVDRMRTQVRNLGTSIEHMHQNLATLIDAHLNFARSSANSTRRQIRRMEPRPDSVMEIDAGLPTEAVSCPERQLQV